METMELHRGRLIDHLQLVVRDLPASKRFYTAVFDTLGIPLGGGRRGLLLGGRTLHLDGGQRGREGRTDRPPPLRLPGGQP